MQKITFFRKFSPSLGVTRPLLFVSFLTFGINAVAVDAPTTGQILQEQRSAPVRPAQRESLKIEPYKPEAVEPGGAKVKLEKITFYGNTAFNEAKLMAAAGKVVGNEYDLAGLQKIADRIAEYYRRHGYLFVRVVLPPQTIGTGRVKMEIIEGRYGELRTSGDAKVAAAAQKWLLPLGEGNVIRQEELERSTLLLSDLPGVLTQPVMRPGLRVGTGDLDVAVKSQDKYNFNVGVDNHGSRFTGYYRARGNLAINSPTMLGDQLLIGVVQSDDNLTLGNTNYSRPIGTNGLRAQVGLAYTSYRLGKDFASANRSGTALVGNTGLTYQLIRSNTGNLTLGGSLVRKNMSDDANASLSRKFSNSIPLSVQFDLRDQLMGPAITFGSVVFTYGSLSLDSSLRALDASSARTEGRFKKFNLDIVRQQQLPKEIIFSIRASGQYSSQGLDSSEDFILGGPSGIRAYPTGEAAGDRGWLTQLELQRRYGDYTPYVFYDHGRIDTNARQINGISKLAKQRAGAGLGLRYNTGNLYADAVIARRTSSDLAESDTTNPPVQAWVTMTYRY
jgi:hemolysin activation/secretion protein